MNILDIIDVNHTISKDLFKEDINAWEFIPKIGDYIIRLGNTLPKDNFCEIEENVWVAKSAKVDKDVEIISPCIIDENTVVRHCAYLRGNVIIGKNCVIGNSSELKNSIVFDNCQIPHFNYVGDSIIGYHSHLSAGVIISNLKSDGSNITIKSDSEVIQTNLRKMGAIIGNYVEVGCNSVIFPGTIIFSNTTIYPLTRVRHIIDKNSIVKSENIIVRKEV